MRYHNCYHSIRTVAHVTLVHVPYFSTSYAKYFAKNRIKIRLRVLRYNLGEIMDTHNNRPAGAPYSQTTLLTKS
uniref:Prohibitin n=1 Tax=Parascaris univalens TaxID=6257 RepID=A0A915AIE2_PARUN